MKQLHKQHHQLLITNQLTSFCHMCTKALIEILGVVLSFEVTILAISGCFSWALEPGPFKIIMFLVALISCFLNTVF